MLWIILVFMIGVAITAVVVSRQSDGFKSAAATLGLKVSRSVPDLLPRLEGMLHGLAVRAEVREDGNSVKYEVFYPALGLSLRLQRETAEFRKLGPAITGDQTTGDTSFDRTFRVNTSRPDALQAMLSNDLRRLLVALCEKYPEAVIADGEISYVSRGADPDADLVVETLQDFVAAALLLVKARPPELEKPQPRPIAAAPPQPRPQPVHKASAQQISAADEPAHPDTAPPAEPVAPVAMPSEPEPVAPTPPSSGLPDGFFDEVFGANRMTFSDEEDFDRKGAHVTLRGSVKQASPYSNRTEFSPTSGTKAVITVAQIETDLYGKTDIDAVVYLAGQQELGRGESVDFSGTLDGVDAFMRNIFVNDARLNDS